MKRFSLQAGIFLLALVVGGGVSLAASYPSKPIQFIAAGSPGGGWDLTCRASAKVLQEAKIVNVPITVLNQVGGSGAVAYNDIVRNRRADDHLLIAFSSVFTSQLALGNIKGTYKDITPVASMVVDYGVLAVKKDSTYKDLKSILSAMKENPAAVSWAGSSAPGGLDHFKLCLLAQAYGVKPKDVRFVTFQGGAEALAALLGGHVAGFVGDAAEIAAHSEAGTVQPLVILVPSTPPWNLQGYSHGQRTGSGCGLGELAWILWTAGDVQRRAGLLGKGSGPDGEGTRLEKGDGTERLGGTVSDRRDPENVHQQRTGDARKDPQRFRASSNDLGRPHLGDRHPDPWRRLFN